MRRLVGSGVLGALNSPGHWASTTRVELQWPNVPRPCFNNMRTPADRNKGDKDMDENEWCNGLLCAEQLNRLALSIIDTEIKWKEIIHCCCTLQNNVEAPHHYPLVVLRWVCLLCLCRYFIYFLFLKRLFWPPCGHFPWRCMLSMQWMKQLGWLQPKEHCQVNGSTCNG